MTPRTLSPLPEHRRAIRGRIHARHWDSAEYGAAVIRFRRRAHLIDRLCWIASALLVAGAAWIAWGPR